MSGPWAQAVHDGPDLATSIRQTSSPVCVLPHFSLNLDLLPCAQTTTALLDAFFAYAYHLAAGANAAFPMDGQSFHSTNIQHIEIVFDQSGRNRSSRDQPDRTFLCPHPGCHVTCKRKYERDRHYQTKHVQSKDLFCPIGHCRCSRDADEVAEVLSDAFLGRYWSPAWNWASSREKMKAETIENLSNLSHYSDDYSRSLLRGFARRDKVIRHIRKAHKDVDTTAEDFSIEREALLGAPIIAELQPFWFPPGGGWSNYWEDTLLARLQRTDGSWTEWFGNRRAVVAAAGFHKCSETDRQIYRLLKKERGYENVLPWEAPGILQELKLPGVGEEHGVGTHSPLEVSSTQNTDLRGMIELGNLRACSHENKQSTSVQLLSTPSSGFGATPGYNTNGLSTGGGVLTPLYYFGEDQPSYNHTQLDPIPVLEASVAAQENNFQPEHANIDAVNPALPVLTGYNDGFDFDSIFNGDFDFSDFNALPQWEPQSTVEHAAEEPEHEAGDYSGLGKRRFSQV